MSISTLPHIPPARLATPIKPAGTERELKFLVSAPAFKATQNWPMLPPSAPRRATRLRSIYYDTPSAALHRHGLSLRLQAQRRGYLLTFKSKTAAGPFERGEAEIFTPEQNPNPSLLGEDIAAAITAATAGQPLIAAFETDIRRITHRIVSPTSDIELAFDSGHIIAGDAKQPIREIELELKSGDPADLFRLGIQLAEAFPVRLSTEQKSDRGFLLVTGATPNIVRAAPPLAGAPSMDEAIAALITDCLTQFIANWPAFFAGDSAGAIHQMRVALRRLRALLGLFHRGFPCPEFAALRAQAKTLAAAMGDARNLDVFSQLITEGPLKAFPEEPGFPAIIEECATSRAAAYTAIETTLAAPETTRFILTSQAFIARHGWRNALSPDSLSRLTAPARDFASPQIARLHQKILKRGGKKINLSPHDRHQLRIELKKLRYAADAFGTLYDSPKQVRAYTKTAAALQDSLGTYNDLITAQDIIATLATANSRAAGILLGWCARGAATGDAGLLSTWKDFRQMKNPFC